MTGHTDLAFLLGALEPHLDPETYVFTTLGDGPVPDGLSPLMQFREQEGWTLIVTKDDAIRFGFDATFECRRITLQVHSSLEAVGLIAAVATALSESGIATNPVSAFFHDHIFVHALQSKEAMRILHDISVS